MLPLWRCILKSFFCCCLFFGVIFSPFVLPGPLGRWPPHAMTPCPLGQWFSAGGVPGPRIFSLFMKSWHPNYSTALKLVLQKIILQNMSHLFVMSGEKRNEAIELQNKCSSVFLSLPIFLSLHIQCIQCLYIGCVDIYNVFWIFWIFWKKKNLTTKN